MSVYSYLGRYLQFLGVEKILIQIIVTIFPLCSFIFPPLLGKLSDKFQNRKIFILMGSIALPIIFISLLFIKDVIFIIILILFYGFFSSSIGLNFILYQELVFNKQKFISYYNSMIVLGWFLGAQLCGIYIDFFGIEYIFTFILLFSIITLILSLFIKEDRDLILTRFNEFNKNTSNFDLLDGDFNISVESSIYYGLFFRNFGIRPIMSIITIIMAFHLSSDSEIGFLVGINPLIQFFLMILMGKVISKRNQKSFIMVGYLLSSVVIIGYIVSTNFIFYLIFQILVSFSYSMFWSATHFYIAENTTPKNKGQYIGLANSSFYLGSFVGGLFFSGILTIQPNYYVAMLPLIIFPAISATIIGLKFKKNKNV
jgi:MFS family permease